MVRCWTVRWGVGGSTPHLDRTFGFEISASPAPSSQLSLNEYTDRTLSTGESEGDGKAYPSAFFLVSSSLFFLSPSFILPAKHKWRAQKLTFLIFHYVNARQNALFKCIGALGSDPERFRIARNMTAGPGASKHTGIKAFGLPLYDTVSPYTRNLAVKVHRPSALWYFTKGYLHACHTPVVHASNALCV